MSDEVDEAAGDGGKIFLSYSRKDRERAAGIADALRARHFGVFKDTDDILPTEEWKTRLEELIAEADTIVFLLSPHSAASEVCAWEVEYAASLEKRIAPIVIEETPAETFPPLISRLNFIFCTPRDPFDDAVDTLASALSTDIDWIREHTRLAGLARRWEGADRPARLLLRGQDIADAESWRDARPKEAPAVTPAQAALIAASRKAASARQRNWITGSLAAAAGAAALAVFAYFQSVEADRQRGAAEASAAEAMRQQSIAETNAAEAEAQRAVAEEARAEAEAQRASAEERRDEALRSESRYFTSLARQRLEAGDEGDALALAIAALPPPEDLDARPIIPEALRTLRDIHLAFRPASTQIFEGGRDIALARTDERYIFATTEDVTIANDQLGETLHEFEGFPGGATHVVASADLDTILIAAPNGVVSLIKGSDYEVVGTNAMDRAVTALEMSADGAYVAIARSGGETNSVDVYDLATGDAIGEFEGYQRQVQALAFSKDNAKLLSAGLDGRVFVHNLGDGSVEGPILEEGFGLNDIAFHPEKEVFAVATEASVFIVDMSGESEDIIFEEETPTVVAYAPDGDLFIGYVLGRVERWEPGDDEPAEIYKGHETAILDIEINADGTRLYTVSEDTALVIWRLDHKGTLHDDVFAIGETDAPVDMDVGDDGVVTMLIEVESGFGRAEDRTPVSSFTVENPVDADFNAALGRVATLDGDGAVAIWSPDGEWLSGFESGIASPRNITLSDDGEVVAIAGEDGQATLWSRESGAPILADLTPLSIDNIALNAAGLVAVKSDDTVRWRDAANQTGEVPFGFEVWDFALSADGARAAAVSYEDEIAVVDLATDETLLRFKSPIGDNDASGVALDPTGRILVVWSSQGWVSLWRVDDGELIRVARSTKRITTAAFSPNGEFFVFVGLGGEVSLLEAETGERFISTQERLDTDHAPIFSPNASYMLLRSDGEARLHRTYDNMKGLLTFSHAVAEAFARVSEEDKCLYGLPDRGECTNEPDRQDYRFIGGPLDE